MGDVIVAGIVGTLVMSFLTCGVMSSDSDFETHHFVMAFFWPVTVAIFLVIGPFVAAYFTIRSCLGLFKD